MGKHHPARRGLPQKRRRDGIGHLGGALGAVVGAVTQWSIGWIVQNLSFAPIFAFCAFAYLIALALVHLLIGRLGVIRQVS